MHSSCIQSIPSAIVIALLLSTACKINAVPLSWRGHFKGSSSMDPSPSMDLPTQQAGRLSDRLSEGVRSLARGRSPTYTPSMPSNPPVNFPGSCNEDAPPEFRIQELRQRFIDLGPHPMFYISEVAEMIHRQVYYQENGNCNNWTTASVLEQTINSVKERITGYLNIGLPSKEQVLCPPKYNVTYYGPGRYPFYQVEVICTRESASTNPCSCDSSNRRRCAAYGLNYMRHLERVPATMSNSNSTLEEWREVITDVGVGCKCDST